MHRRRIFFPFILLFTAALACANPLGEGGNAPANVETIVARTLQALTAPVHGSGDAPLPSTPSLLPHSMYFLKDDSAGVMQVFRLEKEGKTVTQVTFEPADVDGYDVASVSGSVVYASNRQLLLVETDGSDRRLLVEGGTSGVSYPVFSPDEQTIAYGADGLYFYSLTTGQSNRVLENKLEEIGNGTLLLREQYLPESYSADGTKIAIKIGNYEGATAAIYYPNGNTLILPHDNKGSMIICCNDVEWAANGSAFYAASPISGMFDAGLWRMDAATGNVTTLLIGNAYTDPANLANAPFPAPDGQLYFFFASLPNPNRNDFPNGAPLQLVRSALDGVTNRTILRPETFQSINEVLWAPDASFVIVAMAPDENEYRGGAARLVYTDGGKSIVPLVPFAAQMKWGP